MEEEIKSQKILKNLIGEIERELKEKIDIALIRAQGDMLDDKLTNEQIRVLFWEEIESDIRRAFVKVAEEMARREDKVFCKCGEEMELNKCPGVEWHYFFSSSKFFIRKEDEVGFTIETSLQGIKEIAEGFEKIIKKIGKSAREGDTIQFNHKGKMLFDIKLI